MINKLVVKVLDGQDIAYIIAYNKNGTVEYFIKHNLALTFGVESIFLAKVVDINVKNKTAFVNYYEDKIGFMNLKQEKNHNLQKGSMLLCQLAWLGDKSKLEKLEDNINYVGKYVILINRTMHKFACQITKPLQDLANKYLDYGVIFRSCINTLSDISLIENELLQLINNRTNVLRLSANKSSVSCLHQGLPYYLQILRNLSYNEDFEIITNNEKVFNNILPYVDLWQINQLSIDNKLNIDINHLENLKQQNTIANSSYSLEIHNLSGINLIDVNSHGASQVGNIKISFYQVNYLAIDEIVRQIKLRDLTGIILLDFIKDMTLSEKEKIYDKLNILLKDDWRHVKLLGFSNAGIFEVIRNK